MCYQCKVYLHSAEVNIREVVQLFVVSFTIIGPIHIGQGDLVSGIVNKQP